MFIPVLIYISALAYYGNRFIKFQWIHKSAKNSKSFAFGLYKNVREGKNSHQTWSFRKDLKNLFFRLVQPVKSILNHRYDIRLYNRNRIVYNNISSA